MALGRLEVARLAGPRPGRGSSGPVPGVGHDRSVRCGRWRGASTTSPSRSPTLSPNTVAAYRSAIWRGSWRGPAGRASRTRPRSTACVLRRYLAYLGTRGLRAAQHRPQGLRAAALLRLAPARRRHRRRIRPGRCGRPSGEGRLPQVLDRARARGAAGRAARPGRPTTRPSVRLRDDAVLEVLYGCGLRVGRAVRARPAGRRPPHPHADGVGQGRQAAPGAARASRPRTPWTAGCAGGRPVHAAGPDWPCHRARRRGRASSSTAAIGG